MPTAADRAEGFSPELRASLYHFTVFASTGAGSAYFAIWMSGKGLSAGQIGIVNAVPVLIMLAANVLLGRIADRADDWRTVIIGLSVAAAIAPIGLFFVDGFWGLLLVFTLTTIPSGAVVPIIDAATLRLTARRGTDFGFVRAWGTVGYMVTSALAGVVIGWLGGWIFLPMFLGLSLLRAILSFPLPQFRAPPHVDAPVRQSRVKVTSLFKPWFVLPCVAYALLQSTHYVIGAMGGLVWVMNGIPEGWVGPLIAISAASEAAMMFLSRRVGRIMSARTMLIVAGVGATLRWSVMALNPPLPILIVLQLMHAVTYAIGYLGIMHFIANWAPEEIAAEAQSLSSALTQGFSVVTVLIFGWLVGQFGGHAYFLAAAMTVVAVGASYWSLRLRPAHTRSDLSPA